MSDRATPETDAVWDDKSRNILTHSRNLERQRDEARERGVMTTTEQLHAYQERTESLRKMVETRDLIIKDLERKIRELREALNGTPSEWDGKRTEVGA